MSYWGATVIFNLFTLIPFGHILANTLFYSFIYLINRIFSIHFTSAFLILFGVIIHIIFLHIISSWSYNHFFNYSLSIYSTFKDFSAASMISLTFISSISFLFFIFHNPDNSTEANPLITPSHILPEWYFLWLYSLLRAFPSKSLGLLSIIFFLYFTLNISFDQSRIFYYLLLMCALFMYASFLPIQFIISLHRYHLFALLFFFSFVV